MPAMTPPQPPPSPPRCARGLRSAPLWAAALLALLAWATPDAAQAQDTNPTPSRGTVPPPKPALEEERAKIPKEDRLRAYKAASGDKAKLDDGALRDTPSVQPKLNLLEGFSFGTYGRARAGTDFNGGAGTQTRVIAHAPRLLEGSYAELDFGYIQKPKGTKTQLFTRITLALGGELFHYDGQFDTSLAVRNLYLEARNVGVPGLSVWGGSRMYRGDDIYLLDFWPLDEQNTVGAGVGYALNKSGTTNVRLHVGFNRLADLYQIQTIEVPNADFGTQDVTFMERQRTVATLRGEHHLKLKGGAGVKFIGYGEGHFLPQGDLREDDLELKRLPSDAGWLGGVEVGFYGFAPNSYANVFFRYGSDLGAFDELGIPTDLTAEETTDGAGDLLVGISANWEPGDLGLLLGAYGRYFEDPDPVVFDPDDGWEVGAALRPAWFITDNLHLITEANLQYRRPNGISQETGTQEIPMVAEFAVMPSVSLGRGSYSRPQLRLMYAVTFLNDSALLTYAPEDPLRGHSARHFLGVSVEWWFNSSRG